MLPPEKPVVDIGTACIALTKTGPMPALAKGDNAKVALARHRGALAKDKATINASRACQEKQREYFGKGGS